jgi:crossover junction endodeoxyribonuclease RuvC
VRVLGIDPGSRVTGWGVVESRGEHMDHVGSGTVVLEPSVPLGIRLARLYAECLRLLDEWSPAALVLERNFVARNVQSAFRLGEARGAILAAAGAAGIALHEYAPATVKLAAVGHGQADKRAVGRGVTLRLRLARIPLPDAADALALALCHLHQAPLAARVASAMLAQADARSCGGGQTVAAPRALERGARQRGARY